MMLFVSTVHGWRHPLELQSEQLLERRASCRPQRASDADRTTAAAAVERWYDCTVACAVYLAWADSSIIETTSFLEATDVC
jgi:hypothetical protein